LEILSSLLRLSPVPLQSEQIITHFFSGCVSLAAKDVRVASPGALVNGGFQTKAAHTLYHVTSHR
jgi:hypothetical protein